MRKRRSRKKQRLSQPHSLPDRAIDLIRTKGVRMVVPRSNRVTSLSLEVDSLLNDYTVEKGVLC
jgi:hypothetical protein